VIYASCNGFGGALFAVDSNLVALSEFPFHLVHLEYFGVCRFVLFCDIGGMCCPATARIQPRKCQKSAKKMQKPGR
jgi:hypothetical protein